MLSMFKLYFLKMKELSLRLSMVVERRLHCILEGGRLNFNLLTSKELGNARFQKQLSQSIRKENT